MPKIDERIRAGIVARVVAKKSKAAAEAKKYGIPAATVRNWVHEAKARATKSDPEPSERPTLKPPTPDNGPSQKPSPTVENPTPKPSGGSEPSYDSARAAAGLPPVGKSSSTPPPGPGNVEAAAAAAEEDDRKLIVDTYQDFKSSAVDLIAARFKLPGNLPALQPAREMKPIVRTVLRINAGLIAPIVRGHLVGWPALVGVMVFDVIATVFAVRNIAAVLGPQRPPPPPPKETPAPPAPDAPPLDKTEAAAA